MGNKTALKSHKMILEKSWWSFLVVVVAIVIVMVIALIIAVVIVKVLIALPFICP